MMVRTLCAMFVIGTVAAPARAQQAGEADGGAIDVSATFNVMNQYVFRGVRQNDTGVAMWPAGDIGLNVHSGEGTVKRVRLKFGFLNSLHTGDTGSGGPTGRSWYESRVSGALAMQLAGGVSVEGSYTTFMSPNDMFSTTKEVAIKVAMDDHHSLGDAALNPYAFIAFEVDAGTGEGQLDGGMKAGRYLEFGVAPKYSTRRIGFAAPVSVGLSIGDYYELATEDHTFGFASIGGIATVPVRRSPAAGSWNVRGGVQYQLLGTTPKAFNGGDRTQLVGSIGVEFSH